MIAYICGDVLYKENDCVIVKAGGVGYEIRAPKHTLNSLNAGDNAELYTSFIVSDAGLALYGFETLEEKRVFDKLRGVNKVGGRTAMSVISEMSVSQIASAVAAGDKKAFSRVPGIGAKTAELIILELKGKLSPVSAEEASAVLEQADAKNVAIDSLIGLGFTQADSAAAVEAVSVLCDTAEDMVVLALKRLGM